MNSPGNDVSQSLLPGVTEEEWVERKKAVLKMFSKGRSSQRIDRENLTREKERVKAEVERIEKENHVMARSANDIQLQLFEKRKNAQILFQRSDDLKKKLGGLLSRERSILNEIEYYESEKVRLSKTNSEFSKKLDRNIHALGGNLDTIGFMKGEIEMLIDKMRMLEGDIPEKTRGLDDLDEKIIVAVKILKTFYQKMQHIERNVKTNYYHKRKE
jgi:chromosome segregation ATPase